MVFFTDQTDQELMEALGLTKPVNHLEESLKAIIEYEKLISSYKEWEDPNLTLAQRIAKRHYEGRRTREVICQIRMLINQKEKCSSMGLYDYKSIKPSEHKIQQLFQSLNTGKVFIVSKNDQDLSEIIGVFQTLKGATDFVESLDDSIPFALWKVWKTLSLCTGRV